MAGLRFKDLATTAGVQATYGQDTSPADNERITQRAAYYLQKHPGLANMPVAGADFDAYDYSSDRFLLNKADPDIVAHEAEHAIGLADETLYRKLLHISQRASSLGNAAAVPAVFGLMPFIDDTRKRRTILKVLAGITAAAAIPNLIEEAKASTRVVADSPDKMQSIRRLLPAFASHLASDLAGPAIYLGGLAMTPED